MVRMKQCEQTDESAIKMIQGQGGGRDGTKGLGMDLNHYGGEHSLTLIDSGPFWFMIWQPIQCQDSV